MYFQSYKKLRDLILEWIQINFALRIKLGKNLIVCLSRGVDVFTTNTSYIWFDLTFLLVLKCIVNNKGLSSFLE